MDAGRITDFVFLLFVMNMVGFYGVYLLDTLVLATPTGVLWVFHHDLYMSGGLLVLLLFLYGRRGVLRT